MNICDCCKRFASCPITPQPDDALSCIHVDPITRADLAAKDAEIEALRDEVRLTNEHEHAIMVELSTARNEIADRDAEIAVDAGRLRDAAMRVWGEDAHGCDTPDRLADAILGLRAQIADLKRGGVDAAELDAIYDAIRCIGNKAYHASTGPAVPDALWDIRRRAYDVCARIDGIRAIPADRVLGEGCVAVDREEWEAVNEFANLIVPIRDNLSGISWAGRLSDVFAAYDRWYAVRIAAGDALRAQATQEAAP